MYRNYITDSDDFEMEAFSWIKNTFWKDLKNHEPQGKVSPWQYIDD